MSHKVSFASVGEIPMLLSFHQGVSGTQEVDVKFNYTAKGEGKKRKRIVSAEINEICYKGADFGEDSMKQNSLSYAVGVLDEATGEFVIVPTEHIFVMKPNIQSNLVSNNVTTATSHFEKKQQLAVAFGSSKKQRAIQAAQSNVISVENIAGAQSVEMEMKSSTKIIHDASDDIKNSLLNAASDALEVNRTLLLPAFNTSLDIKVDQIYPIDGIIPYKVKEDLEEYYTNNILTELIAQSMDLESVDTWVTYFKTDSIMTNTVLDIINNSKHILSSKKGRKHLIPQCIYLNSLIIYYVLLSNNRDHVVSKEDVLKHIQKGDMKQSMMQCVTDTFSNYRKHKGQPSFTASKSNM